MSARLRQCITTAVLALTCLSALALPAVAGAPARLLVIAKEYSFLLSRGSVPRGAVTVELYNRGQDAHNLNVRRLDPHGNPVGSTQAVTTTLSGGLAEATWRLGPGRYVFYCSLPSHEQRGMKAYLVVR